MNEHQFRTRKWSGWWYLETRSRGAGCPWGDWRHVVCNPNREWITRHYPEEVNSATHG